MLQSETTTADLEREETAVREVESGQSSKMSVGTQTLPMEIQVGEQDFNRPFRQTINTPSHMG